MWQWFFGILIFLQALFMGIFLTSSKALHYIIFYFAFILYFLIVISLALFDVKLQGTDMYLFLAFNLSVAIQSIIYMFK
jgi:hypothetical protein